MVDQFVPKKIGAVLQIKDLFMTGCRPLSLADIRHAMPALEASQISMALCYLMRKQQVRRESIDNPRAKARKKIWLYTYQGEASNAS